MATENSSLPKSALGPTQPLIQWEGGILNGEKMAWCKVKHSIPSSAEVKNKWNYTSSPPRCLHGSDRDNLTFTEDVTPH